MLKLLVQHLHLLLGICKLSQLMGVRELSRLHIEGSYPHVSKSYLKEASFIHNPNKY